MYSRVHVSALARFIPPFMRVAKETGGMPIVRSDLQRTVRVDAAGTLSLPSPPTPSPVGTGEGPVEGALMVRSGRHRRS